MQISPFPGCCGIYILHGFPCNSSAVPQQLTSGLKTEMTSFLKKCIKEQSHVGILMVALNELQIKAGLEDVVRGMGFKRVKKPAYHPGHARCIGVYTYELHPENRKDLPLRKRVFEAD